MSSIIGPDEGLVVPVAKPYGVKRGWEIVPTSSQSSPNGVKGATQSERRKRSATVFPPSENLDVEAFVQIRKRTVGPLRMIYWWKFEFGQSRLTKISAS